MTETSPPTRNNNHRGFFIPSGDESWEFRPEEIESIFYAHRITGDTVWADYQWEIFQAMNAASKTNQAYASVNNVDEPYGGTLGDIVDSFHVRRGAQVFLPDIQRP